MATEQQVQELIAFHGHMCVGLAIGIRAAEAGLAALGTTGDDRDLVVATETTTCSVDAVQQLTGCTAGNGKLHIRDCAKNAYSFWRGADAVRVVALPDRFRSDDGDTWALMAAVQDGSATPEQRERFFELQAQWSQAVLQAATAELFEVGPPLGPPPERDPITRQVPCDDCGEAVMEHRAQRRHGRRVCVTCAAGVPSGQVRS